MNINDKIISRFTALTILVLLIYAAWFLIFSPYISQLNTKYMRLDRSAHKVRVLNDLINNKDQINNTYRAMMNNRSLERVYLTRGGGVVAEAKLQGIVRKIIEKNNSNLIQTSRINTAQEDKNKITLKVSMRGSINSTYKIFYELENSWPVMTINNLDLQKITAGYIKNEKKGSLNSVFEITAYVQ